MKWPWVGIAEHLTADIIGRGQRAIDARRQFEAAIGLGG